MVRILFSILFIGAGFAAAAQHPLTRIAFGSCSHEGDPEQMWTEIVNQKPQLWIWLGDNIYGDTDDMNILRQKYETQKKNPGYQKLMATCPIIGTWDDHDYGINDGGKDFPKKKESKELMLSFLDVPAGDPVRKHEGVYSSHTYGTGKQKVKVILLDTRYFRDPLKESTAPNTRYTPSDTGDFLGEEQWAWLEQELKSSDAAINIIGSSIQFIQTTQGYEKWENLRPSRRRMLDLLKKYKPKGTLFISGDRHIAEVARLNVDGLPYPLYDFTSSGLTHTWDSQTPEPNPNRVGDLIIQKNFGLILIDWSHNTPRLTLEVQGKQNKSFEKITINY